MLHSDALCSREMHWVVPCCTLHQSAAKVLHGASTYSIANVLHCVCNNVLHCAWMCCTLKHIVYHVAHFQPSNGQCISVLQVCCMVNKMCCIVHQFSALCLNVLPCATMCCTIYINLLHYALMCCTVLKQWAALCNNVLEMWCTVPYYFALMSLCAIYTVNR
jgi:hypothetical protein